MKKSSQSSFVAHYAGYGRVVAAEPRNDGREDRGDTKDGLTAFLQELRQLYPKFTFLQSNRFKFRYPKTIYVDPSDENFALLSLHELGHALCQHRFFATDAERLKIEREAWERARTVFLEHPAWAKKYHFHFDDNFIETQLDTYRDWLHTKSTCKKCGLTRYQTPHGSYRCPRCDLLLKSL